MDEYKKFLADRLLSDEQPITYRLLSRALGIHVNTAKEMLYDYHTYQNGIKAESIHATYIVYGTKTQDNTAKDGDVEMSSSMPEHEPLSETVPTTTLALVRQENLEAALAEYQEVVSIHVYSLAPGPQRDVSLLYDVARSLAEYTSKEDPLTAGEKYGTIRNLNVRRRDRQARPKPGSSTSSQSTNAQPAKAQPPKAQPVVPIKSEPAATKKPSPFEVAAAAAKLKKQPSSQTPSSSETPTSSAAKSTPPLKRGGSGSIMQSFAKTKPPKPKPEPKKEEDTEMALSDDGEADDEDIAQEKAEYKDSDAVRKSRKQREEELRRMMEEDDEEEKSEEEPADEEMEEAPEPEPEPEEEPKEKEKEKEPTEITTTTTNGRRRGRRQVMKKERVMDEQGYLVTIQKPGWESFSEDEAPPPKKPATASSVSSTPTSSAGKAKKPAAKGAQGNIMSFFAKKS